MTRRPSIIAACALVATCTLVATARAQEPPPAAAAPGVRIVSGQSPVIGGNGAGARERALEDAFRQAVDQSLAELLDAATRAGQARAIKALEARARTYVRRYRALEEGEVNGAYSVKLEVEVDEAALRRAAESWGQSSAVAVPAPVVAGFLLVPAADDETTAAATSSLLTALASAGARAQVANAKDAADAQRAATRATLPQVAFVSAHAAGEGPVRGTTNVSVACRVAARVVSASSGLALGEPDAAPRAFAADEAAARAECLTRAAGELATRLAPGGSSGSSPARDLRAVTVEADVVEPAAVVALLKDVRSIGSVSSAELRRVAPGHAEIRARTRALATALAPALARDPALALSNVEVAGDVIRLRARLRAPAAP